MTLRSLASHNDQLYHQCFDLWFLTGGHVSPGSVNKFPGGNKRLRAVQHGKFDQQILPINTFVLQLI